ncbi:hypothetical protein R3P38DRAFT_2533376, partial [Favolaschia claudopus]
SVMCPHRKLQWFRQRCGWNDDQVSDLRSLVVRRFTESYKTSPTTASPSSSGVSASSTVSKSRPADRFRRPTTSLNPAITESDNIHTYLDAPLCEPTTSVIEYWTARLKSSNPSIVSTPDLARYALSFCSCPGKLFLFIRSN